MAEFWRIAERFTTGFWNGEPDLLMVFGLAGGVAIWLLVSRNPEDIEKRHTPRREGAGYSSRRGTRL